MKQYPVSKAACKAIWLESSKHRVIPSNKSPDAQGLSRTNRKEIDERSRRGRSATATPPGCQVP
eukprot:CAMPEP_0172768974 /NCGR_PEP_ID=MMETSP1074-20121228/185737_1 /TAXON_ID=2916 /ORGANISM="Ceratium fusus, Strain PA161109" /LENGTH=63 /DNA_ID=CAMNT_0013604459 /DNA_START=306 /DNA_END=494 /DNA_ORIENTATION=-